MNNFYELNQLAQTAFKSNQVPLCSYKRRKYLLVDVNTYWGWALLLRNTPECIERFNANDFQGGEEITLEWDELPDLKIVETVSNPL